MIHFIATVLQRFTYTHPPHTHFLFSHQPSPIRVSFPLPHENCSSKRSLISIFETQWASYSVIFLDLLITFTTIHLSSLKNIFFIWLWATTLFRILHIFSLSSLAATFQIPFLRITKHRSTWHTSLSLSFSSMCAHILHDPI